ncbi:MAG: ABC transporter ATP-binding protein [Thermanaerothrix sp.]|uniref:ABC transporter ATP-binding protein n=1 Tax=Thermanaerothrix solaris TaxID=3058434 RepID=A0ABU3NP82_9CHLR|nr:ABC transporter ATP-binding protein [Thermanaerothrix sp. 4228-RoL]MDT8898649.1 ABC transporter ATP-binding protein [Thermanaerothrix sp. 4228-RoL]
MRIITENLTKIFNTRRNQPPIVAVEDLNLDIHPGEVFGLLGPNGAGKTTTVRMLTTLIAPTAGQAFVGPWKVGRDDRQIRQSVGLLTEAPGMYEALSAEKNLTIYARLYNVRDVKGQVEKYLRMLGLWERRADPVGSFSKGMRQKLAIARALLHEPQVLFLDEPTSGLDPEAAKLVRDFIEELESEGRTIVLCTHNLDEAERLCHRVVIFKTRLIAVDTPENLRKRLFGRKVVFHLRQVQPQWVELLRSFPFVEEVSTLENRIIVGLPNPEEQNPVLVRRLVEAGAEIQFVGELRHTLEDVYLRTLQGLGE